MWKVQPNQGGWHDISQGLSKSGKWLDKITILMSMDGEEFCDWAITLELVFNGSAVQ